MPLSRLENFLINTDGNILYVNPSDLDATDSFDNKGNSLTRPFKTLQRALIEAARFSYQIGPQNDRFDRTTILLYPGTHVVDNRPGLFIKNNAGSAQYFDQNQSGVSPNIEFSNSTVFDLDNAANVLYKFNSVDGGLIVPKGTSIVGLDLRKTKIRPLYVPDPTDNSVDRSAIFRITGGCYFWQFSIFDADQSVFINKNFATKKNPSFSHHKLTCFEYVDGINEKALTGLTDLQMYYFKLMNAYGASTGNRQISDFPGLTDFEPNSPEFKIVGDLSANDLVITELTSDNVTASVTTQNNHNLNQEDSFRITGVGASSLYEGSYRVSGITSDRKFEYKLLADANDDVITLGGGERVVIEADNVTGASPYIFNISLRSVFGMCGMHADGAKATGFKSMVVAQFTGIGLQKDPNAFVVYNKTTGQYDTNDTAPNDVPKPLYINQDAIYKPSYENFHVKASNNSVIQAVSVFAIGFAQHFLAEDGADQSITNSNSNFGAKSLVSVGFRKDAFDRDNTGYVTHIIPPTDRQEDKINIGWKILDPVETVAAATTSRIYLKDETDEGNPPSNISDGYRVGSNYNENLFLDVRINNDTRTFSAPVLMQVPSGDGPLGQKLFTVSRTANVNDIDVANDVLTLDTDHNLLNGESITLNSDNGVLPGGINHETTYFAIVGGSLGTDEIKLASTFNNALNRSAINIKNTLGGIITVISRVSDKVPGELGHPIQYDDTRNNWYVTSSSSNDLYNNGFIGFSTAINENNSASYIRRMPENRDLDDRIYKLRYVIPKEFSNAKAPTKNFVLQESSDTLEQFAVNTAITGSNQLTDNRNPRTISGISTSGLTVTVTTDTEHRLQLNDRVLVKSVVSAGNTTGAAEVGFNGYHTVTSVTGSRTFTYTLEKNPGNFTDNIETLRGGNDPSLIPTISKNEYDTTYIIREVEVVQEYEDNIQDGIYYLTCLIGNISPTVSEFAGKKFKQDYSYIYPTIDKDNPVNDPTQAISAASNELIGKVNVNDERNSISKEGIIDYLKDNRVGFGITGAVWAPTGGPAAGIATFFLDRNHNLDRITSISLSVAGSNYGAAGTRYNVPLIDQVNSRGVDATANIVVNGSGNITSAEIVNGGSAFGIGNTLAVSGGDGNGVVQVATIRARNDFAFQVVGVGTLGNRFDSGYNGVYEVNTVGTEFANQIEVSIATNPGIYTSASRGIIFPVDKESTVSSIAGITTTLAGIVTVTTSESSGYSVGNKIKITGVTGTGATIYNSDFIVNRIINDTNFEIKSTIGIGTALPGSNARVLKYGLGAFGRDTSLQSERIGGSMIEFSNLYKEQTSTLTTATATTINFNFSPTSKMSPGDFLQIKDEIVRITSITNADSIVVIRGVMGTRAKQYAAGTVVRGIKIIPSELRRFSSIRASGHTFEYVGYGPGNYSTALPQRIQRTLTTEEETLAIYCEKKGGVTFYSGMNDRGEFFTWDGRTKPVERFISDIGNDFTGIFDDLYVRNTLRVGGGPNKNLPSEFQGPVQFSNKITNTDTVDGINAIKLQIRGSGSIKPFFSVGPEDQPSLVVNQSSQKVGINTAQPAFELDVNGTIRATTYENFKLSDLPNTPTEEVTFKRNRVLKVNDEGTGYELVDPHTLAQYVLTSYGVSNDGTVHVGTGSTESNKLKISGIGTSRFVVGEKVKLFGVNLSSDNTLVGGVPSVPTFTKVGVATGTVYRYWVAQYDRKTGKVGVGTQINPAGGSAPAGIAHTTIENFNDQNHIVLTLNRASTDLGLLVYRSEGSTSINDAKLVGILGPKELGTDTSGIQYKDYGVYDKTAWSENGEKNEFTNAQIHFPNIATTGQRRGWALDEIVSIGASSITVNNAYDFNDAVGFGTDAVVKVTHDNTYALTTAMNDIISRGGSYLELPSGTYLSNQIIIPTSFTIKGNGRNTILKQQYFALDETDGGGNTINGHLDGNFVGIGTTNGKDVTITDVTIDGNNTNNIRFVDDANGNNYLVYFKGVSSSLFKGMEIRNSPAHGLTIEDSSRVSIENCSFVDGSITDRYPFEPLYAQESEVLRVNDSLFEGFPGPVDVSASSVVSTGGNIIRNCGTGLRTYATGKITTTNNILLGPADEFIPSPDIYDSDFNSINITIDRTADFIGPEFQYIEDGDPKDLSSGKVAITAGIGTIVGQGTTNETLGTKFISFNGGSSDDNISTPDAGEFGRANGYLQLRMPLSDTQTLGIGSALGYEILGVEFDNQPTGYTTYIGISTGAWFKNNAAFIGAGATEYRVTLNNISDFPGIAVGDVVKLVDHSVSPSLSTKELTVSQKHTVDAATKQLRLTGITTTSIANGAPAAGATVNGYISIRKQFVIAKGRVGVI